MRYNIIADITQTGMPSVYIKLTQDQPYIAGLIDFCSALGVASEEISFNLFEDCGQKYQITVEQTTINQIIKKGHHFIFQYTDNEKLSQLFYEQAQYYQSSCTEQHELPVYESLTDLWSAIGTGMKKEATPTQHLDISIDNELYTVSMLKNICYFVLRLGLYHTSLTLPVSEKRSSHSTFIYRITTENTIQLQDVNTILFTGGVATLPNVVAKIAQEHHVGEGGLLGVWERQLQREIQPSEETVWHAPSEATRLLHELQGLEGTQLNVYMTLDQSQRQVFQQTIRQYNDIEKICVRSAFKTGYYWLLEEVLPSYPQTIKKIEIICKTGDCERGLELNNRWIMEMYPVDEMIATQYGIEKDAIQFELNNMQEDVYHIRINGEDYAQLTPLCQTFPYIDGHHTVSPTTAGYCLDGTPTIMATDRELFYRKYTEEYLPKLAQQLVYDEGAGTVKPLFNKLAIHYTSSGIEERIPVKSERNSSFEALYEDVYFNTLHYFKQLGIKQQQAPYTAPGGVVPYIHINTNMYEETHARIIRYDWQNETPKRMITHRITCDNTGKMLRAYYTLDGMSHGVVVKEAKMNKNQWYQQVESYTCATITQHHQSYLGELIPVVEVTQRLGGTYYSPLKKTTYKHTVLIEAGHHANEVSSTPAVSLLLEQLQTTHAHYLERLNFIIIPMANPDGAHLLQELCEEHPEWKHHAARFNAVGLEFAHMKFKESIFGEAAVVPTMLKRWAPDIIIDNHGIPAHEWVQPFAGYTTPPLFPVSYNLPSAKIYGIGRYGNSDYTHRHQVNLASIATQINTIFANTPFAQENEYWRSRFEKYGTAWNETKYPVEAMGNINFYQEATVTPTYPSVSILRYPKWVAADIISEAADEVVYGDELLSCIAAQYLFNWAIIQQVYETPVIKGEAMWNKQRPIVLKEREA